MKIIDVRRLDPQGPSVLGELLASCPVMQIVTDYQYPAIDIQWPAGAPLPNVPVHVALYSHEDNKFGGILLLDHNGFHVPPDWPKSETPYFKMALIF